MSVSSITQRKRVLSACILKNANGPPYPSASGSPTLKSLFPSAFASM